MRTLWLVAVAGCAQYPEVIDFEAQQDGDKLDAFDPREVEELVFSDDLPVDVSFLVTFDETMTLPSAREGIWIEDADGVALDVELEARLQAITVLPQEPLVAGENHTLVVQSSVADNSGAEMLGGYRVAFYTEEE